jgi:hypothetical protein
MIPPNREPANICTIVDQTAEVSASQIQENGRLVYQARPRSSHGRAPSDVMMSSVEGDSEIKKGPASPTLDAIYCIHTLYTPIWSVV